MESKYGLCKTADVSVFKQIYVCGELFLFHLANSQRPCLNPLRFHFRSNSSTKIYVNEVFQFVDQNDNPLCASMFGIKFVQKNEPPSGVLLLFENKFG